MKRQTKQIKKSIYLLSTALLVACAGRTPAPIPQYQLQDEMLQCHDIAQEISDNQTKIMSLIPQQDKLTKNVLLAAASTILVLPALFMDFSDAERIEIQAYQLRNNRLRILFDHKKCQGELPSKIQTRI